MKTTLAVWLLCMALPCLAAWTSGPGFRWKPLPAPVGTGGPGFARESAAALGITFTNALSADRVTQFQNLMNGSGVGAADVDGDGLVDLYFCHKQAGNRLYRNRGDGRFEDVTASAGVECLKQTSVGAVFGDLNGDGSPDLLVSGFGGPNACLINDGKGRFRDATVEAGLTGKSGATSMALSDIDGDGDLDVYGCNFAVQAILRDGALITTRMVDGQPVVTGRHANRVKVIDGLMMEFGDPDVLWINDGKGRFQAAPWEKTFSDVDGKPVSAPQDFGLAVQMRDINGDGNPDIYVCNDFQTPDRLWFGDGQGRFRAADPGALRSMSYASMGVDFADLDRDGHLDFITVEMLGRELPQHLRTSSPMSPVQRPPGVFSAREDVPRNCLYRNRGDGSWAEIALAAGVAASGWSWTPLFLDVDLDGWEDLLVSNGHLHDVNNRDVASRSKSSAHQAVKATRDLLLQYPPLTPPKYAFRNRRDFTFEETGAAWGFDATEPAHGMIAVDLDQDGDLDVVANALNGSPLVFRNRSSAPRVSVRLKGRAGNPDGVGAKIRLEGGPVVQTQEIVAGGQYLSHSEPIRVFAAGAAAMSLEVRWRSGRISRIAEVRSGRLYEIDEAGATETPAPVTRGPVPTRLTEATAALAHRHTEEPFDDFARQPLLHRRMAQEGPSVLLEDLNGDGFKDLAIGAGRGGRVAIRLGDGRGHFRELTVPGDPAPDDILGLAFVRRKGGGELLAAVSSFESATSTGPSVLRWRIDGDAVTVLPPLPSIGSSPSALVLGDWDGDGDPDLFVGARLQPGRWPHPAASRIFTNESGQWVPDPSPIPAFGSAGMVTGAVAADLDGDGRMELITCAEFGSVRIYRVGPKGWEDATAALGLDSGTGLWNGLVVADVDRDGRSDLIVGNEGFNTAWNLWGDGRPQVLAEAPAADAGVAVVEAVRLEGRLSPVRDRQVLSAGIPDLPSRFTTHEAFSVATAEAVLGSAPALRLVATERRSMAFLQRGQGFEGRPLPSEAQWSPVTALAAADVDGDGRMDLALAQNRFCVRPEDMPQDGGMGCVLRGDGAGGFQALPAAELGLRIPGEQGGVALGDLDGDGRPDLVVTQNGAQTVLGLSRRP